ncbi:MAG: SAM-dependent methyltransferase, partial [Achromobacter pestifer]
MRSPSDSERLALNDAWAPEAAAALPWTDRLLRQRLLGRLAGLRGGQLIVDDVTGSVELGVPGAGQSRPVRVCVRNLAFYRALAGNGSVGAGEAYGDGWWECDDLVGLIRLLARNRELVDGMERGMARLGSVAMRVLHACRRNTRAGSRRNIAAHYDLGND